jgi:cyanate lyase
MAIVKLVRGWFGAGRGKRAPHSAGWTRVSAALIWRDLFSDLCERATMKREQLTEKILDLKREKDWTWKYVAEEIGGMSPVLVVGALLGQMKLPKALAEKAAALFGLSEVEKRMLNETPMRGMPMPPTDPLLYRFYEMVMVNGPAWKALIEEEFGDGIMSAIDFDLRLDRLPNPKGDRVQLVMSGKFLPYKYYGAEQGIPEYGFKEE